MKRRMRPSLASRVIVREVVDFANLEFAACACGTEVIVGKTGERAGDEVICHSCIEALSAPQEPIISSIAAD